MPRVLVVDDDPELRDVLWEYLVGQGYAVALAETGDAALTLAQEWPPDVALVDLADMLDGRAVLRELGRDVPVIVIHGHQRP